MNKKPEFQVSEMEANYPYFREFVYAAVRKEFERTLEELPDVELDVLARQENSQPLEAFIDELERPVKA